MTEKRLPPWLHRKLPSGNTFLETRKIVGANSTVCAEAKCPNQLECWSKKTATFLILGKECTRCCPFCDIDYNKNPLPPDPEEPHKISNSIKSLQLRHAVITMVTRDDLSDGGAKHLAKVITTTRKDNPTVSIEVLTSDFNNNKEALDIVLESTPEVFNHNIETVRELSPKVRHKATYEKSLQVLKYTADNKTGLYIKSGIMVGLGETEQQVFNTINDLKEVGCDIITIGQYLQPDKNRLKVVDYITPEQFKLYEQYGNSIGIKHMFCGPFVRSSYQADVIFKMDITATKNL